MSLVKESLYFGVVVSLLAYWAGSVAEAEAGLGCSESDSGGSGAGDCGFKASAGRLSRLL